MSGDKVVNRQEYSYDASGNITSVKQLYNGELNFTEVENTEMTYDKNNRLLTYNGEQVKYDKDGNMTYGPLNGAMTTFVFDCRNRLIQAGDTTYEYDAENNRVAVTTGTKRTEYVVNSQPELNQVLQTTTINGGREEITYYYNVDIKRFINQDVLTGTLERISSLNRYSYVEGNPVSYLDPFGLEPSLWDALHEGIEKAMVYITLAMALVAGVAAIATATGNLALTAYSSYAFVQLYNVNSVLGKINIFISGVDLVTSGPNEDAENVYDFLISLTAIMSPLIDSASNVFKLKAMITEVANLFFGDVGKQVLKIVS